ncbi:hypothetical protein PI124_g5063 [Phytophthora idaei]|nr:hypothetical protein PI124_g5063 [Phytophthora idaei]
MLEVDYNHFLALSGKLPVVSSGPILGGRNSPSARHAGLERRHEGSQVEAADASADLDVTTDGAFQALFDGGDTDVSCVSDSEALSPSPVGFFEGVANEPAAVRFTNFFLPLRASASAVPVRGFAGARLLALSGAGSVVHLAGAAAQGSSVPVTFATSATTGPSSADGAD